MNSQSKDIPHGPQDSASVIVSSPQSIAVYTVLRILLQMKSQLGLEAMLEYIRSYLNVVEQYNPQIKNAVSRAVEIINVSKVYEETVHGKKE